MMNPTLPEAIVNLASQTNSLEMGRKRALRARPSGSVFGQTAEVLCNEAMGCSYLPIPRPERYA